MKGVLCFNGPIQRDVYGEFFSNLLNKEFLDKYFQVVDELIIATRVKTTKEDLSGSGLAKIDDTCIQIVSCPNFTTLKQVIKNKANLHMILGDVIRSADIVFVRVSGSIAIEAAKIAQKNNVPCLVEVVTCAKDVYWNHSIKGKIAMPVMYLQMKRVVYHADYVQYITSEFLQKRYPTKGIRYVCSNVLIHQMSDEEVQKRLNKYSESLRNKKISIATVGTLSVAYKGQQDMIKALRILINQGINIYYHIIGAGDNHKLKKIAAKYGVGDRVIFVGSLLHDDVFKYLNDMDLYIQPSWAEAQGRALIEALSRGLPCVCSNVGGMVEVIQPEFIFKKKNPVDIAKKINCLIDADLKEISKQNYVRSMKFERNTLIQKRKEIFEDVAKKRFRSFSVML